MNNAASALDHVRERETSILEGLAAKGIEPQHPGPYTGESYVLTVESSHSFATVRIDINAAQFAAMRDALAGAA